MTNEEKNILLKDLCARLYYGVKGVYTKSGIEDRFSSELTPFLYGEVEMSLNGYRKETIEFKPYLRPMSSMTEEEAQKYYDLTHQEEDDVWGKCLFDKMVDFCNERHLDFRGLIEMGLAFEAPEEMYEG